MVKTLAMSSDLRWELEDWYARFAEIIDGKLADEWVESFADKSLYAVGTYNNVSTTGAWWYTDRGLVALKERAAYNAGYFWHLPTRTLMMISNIRPRPVEEGVIEVAAAFALFSADRTSAAVLHVAGRYEDKLVRDGEALRLLEHRVIIEGETVPANMGVFL